MPRFVSQKLVRDKLTAFYDASGVLYQSRFIAGEEFQQALKKKMVEEIEELIDAKTEEEYLVEICDVLEVSACFLKMGDYNRWLDRSYNTHCASEELSIQQYKAEFNNLKGPLLIEKVHENAIAMARVLRFSQDKLFNHITNKRDRMGGFESGLWMDWFQAPEDHFASKYARKAPHKYPVIFND